MLFARCATTVLAIAGLTAGCATHAVGTPRSSEAAPPGSTVVTAQELARSVPQGTLMEALERVRPLMLRSRGAAPPLVSVDGSAPAELSLLRTIQASTVREVRLLRSSSSVGVVGIAPNGDVIAADVIVVTTWRGGR